VHIAPAFHHLAACGAHRLKEASENDVNCRECLLAALTPPASSCQPEFHPYGRIYLRDSELFFLRDLSTRVD
jgi:hypothetical protein